MVSKAAAPSKRVYEDIEPECKWNIEEGRDVIELHVHGFKKEHIRVQASITGALTVTGERPLDGPRWSRFRKEFKLPEDYKLNETRAKLFGGILHLIVPKKMPPQAAADVMQEEPQTGGGLGQSGSGKSAAPVETTLGGTNGVMSRLRWPSWGVIINKKRVLLNLAVVAALVGVGVGWFLVWRNLNL